MTAIIRAGFIAIVASLALSACGGGGAPTTNTPASAPGSGSASYTGPAPATADVQAFQVNFWNNVRSQNRCGQCHNATTPGQLPNFARSDNVNLAYAQANMVVNLGQPATSIIVSKVSGGTIPVRFLSFVLIGAAGILVHLAALAVLKHADLAFGPAQAAATVVAMTSNFFLNNVTTYRDRRLKGFGAAKGLLVFYVICGIGTASNLAVASWLYQVYPRWIAPGLVGAIIGAIWNFTLSSQLLWRK